MSSAFTFYHLSKTTNLMAIKFDIILKAPQAQLTPEYFLKPIHQLPRPEAKFTPNLRNISAKTHLKSDFLSQN